MKRLSSRLVSTLLFATLSSFQIANSQDLDTVTISGQVTDQNGAVIPAAVVELTFLKTGLKRNSTSNADGRYRLIQLEPGLYTVRITFAGFASYELKEIATLAGQSLQLDIRLTPAALKTETVVVAAGDTLPVDTRRTVVGGTLSSREALLLPLPSRSVLDLIFTFPGIIEEPLSTRDLAEDRNVVNNNTPEEAGVFSLAGAPAYSNNLTIDGLDNNDDRSARERFQPPLEAVEEVQVITNQFSAEYGRASGGRVNLRTRSGSTEFRGRGFYFFRDEALDANTYRNNSLGLSRLPLQEHVGGFTFSGPIRASSTFFIAYERTKVLDSALIDTLLPVRQNSSFPLPLPTNLSRARLEDAKEPTLAAEVAPFIASINTPSKTTNFTARLDQQFTDMHNLSVVYQSGRLNNLRQFGGGNRLAEALQAKKRNSDAISISDNYVVSS
ncbi:MAG: hypothetical protein DMF69_17445, partial [Acidobacteria bacterium]